MSKTREILLSVNEKKFLLKCLSEHTRLDWRSFDEFRPLKIQFGKEWGSCTTFLGDTCILAQTSCEIQQPKSSRPSEGILNINLELNPMGAPHFEAGRQSDISVQLNRFLEKCFKDSRAVDLESLCIKTSEKVWALRVDLNIMNHGGNLLDCASAALLAALVHFRRPDVTCDGEEFIIHSFQQRDPIPTVIHHYPVAVTYAVLSEGEYILADPSLAEEGVTDAFMMIGLNGFNELCGLHLGGKAELSSDLILSIVNKATKRALTVIEEVKRAVRMDNEAREKKNPVGFHVVEKRYTTAADIVLSESLNQWTEKKSPKKKTKKTPEDNSQIDREGKGSAVHLPKEENQVNSIWTDCGDDVIICSPQGECIQVSDTEEDDVMVLQDGQYKAVHN